MTDLSGVLLLIASLVIGGILVWIIKQVPEIYLKLRSIRTTGIAEVDQLLQSAIDFATKLVEGMDQRGELDQALIELKGKARIKLDLAVDFAVEYIEGILAQAGVPLNIDEELIKKAIQKYVWDNPEIFPSRHAEG